MTPPARLRSAWTGGITSSLAAENDTIRIRSYSRSIAEARDEREIKARSYRRARHGVVDIKEYIASHYASVSRCGAYNGLRTRETQYWPRDDRYEPRHSRWPAPTDVPRKRQQRRQFPLYSHDRVPASKERHTVVKWRVKFVIKSAGREALLGGDVNGRNRFITGIMIAASRPGPSSIKGVR